MNDSKNVSHPIRCTCGKTEIVVSGAPMICCACHCSDCHAGSRMIEALPNAAPVLDAFGGTQHALYRKDRMKRVRGSDLLKSLQVEADSPKRVYASCCNSYLYMDLPPPMHWVPISRLRFQGEPPKLEMRINAKFKKEGRESPTDVPVYSSFPPKFMFRLFSSWIAQLLK